MARCCLWMILLIVCWLSTNLFAIAEPPIVSLSLGPEMMTEGNTLSLYCVVQRMYSSVAIEWVRKTPNTTLILARNGPSYDPRYTFQENKSQELSKEEQLSIISLRKEDTGVYSCIAYDLQSDVPLASADVFVSVSYFPATIACFPDGPITVEEGSTLRMSCTTEIGNPPASFNVLDRYGISDEWTLTQTVNRQTLSLEREIDLADRGYVCKISQHIGRLERSCTIGPFTVIPARPTTKGLKTTDRFPHVPRTSTPRSLNTADPHPNGPTTTTPLTEHPSNAPYTMSPTPWITVSVIGLILSIVSFAVNIFVVVRLQRSNKEAGPPRANKEAGPPRANKRDGFKPYTELQPRYNINKSYTELVNQSVKEENENENVEYDYPGLGFENSYNDVQVQLAAQRCYQNI